MQFKKLGNTDIDVSLICLGTMTWGEQNTKEEAFEQMNYAVENGINFFDTAPVYGFGHSEKLIGKALKKVRDKVVIATKCGLRWGKESLSSLRKDASRKSILEEIDQSLRRLDTDRIDLYQVHWPDLETSQNETMETLLEIQNQGKIRYIGLSNYSAEQIKESLQYGKIISLQPEFSLLAREIEKDTVPLCLEKKIGIIAYSPLASGVLTGKYHKKTKFKDWRSKGIIGTFTGEGFVDNISKVDRLREIAREEGKTCGQTAINWVLRQPGLVTALVGVKNSSQMEENIKAIGWQPSKENCKKIEEIFALPVSGKISKV